MPKQTTIATVREMCLRLGVNHDVEMNRARRADATSVLRAWRELQAKAKESHRRLVYDNHPDRGGDPELCARLNEALQLIESVVPALPPQCSPVRISVTTWGDGWTSSTTTTTGTDTLW